MHIPRIVDHHIDVGIAHSVAWALIGGAMLGFVVWGLAIWKVIDLVVSV